jgi:hypothetical protein
MIRVIDLLGWLQPLQLPSLYTDRDLIRSLSLEERTSMTTTKDAATIPPPLSAEERLVVEDQLERILASPLFSQSKRYAPFLRHVVEKTLEGQGGTLKERTLGVEIFGRAPDYDSSNDPVVRVTAGEVRKRIAQYYHDAAHQNELWIDLPTGTYVAQFRPSPVNEENGSAAAPPDLPAKLALSAELAPVAPEVESVRWASMRGKRRAAVIIILVVLASAGLLWRFGARHTSPLDRVWGNLVSTQSPSIIAVGVPAPLYPTENNTDELSARQHLRNDHVSLSDLQALLRIVKLLDRRDITYRVQPAGSTTFADLRQGPTVLLGGLDNPWTMRAQQNLRFGLQSDGNGVDWISDTHDQGARKWSVDFNRPYTQVTTDYAIIALFRDPATQQPTLIIAGMGENGTKAASEFITDDTQLSNALGEALRKPGGSSFEVVITTEVINGSSGAPKVLAKEAW